MNRKPRIAIMGAGRLATALAMALRKSGYKISEIISRNRQGSRRHAQSLARKVSARAVTAGRASFDGDLLWLCVPDGEIRPAAEAIAAARKGSLRYAFHSSGALLSGELASLRKKGAAVASVHPLMTFVANAQPSLKGVPFALEGDPAAVQLARRMVRDFGGQSFALQASRKAAYHTWATFTSPLWLAFLVTLEEAASVAGLTAKEARHFCMPIVQQTLQNYVRLGPRDSFSGPLIRGDVETVVKHLSVLQRQPRVRAVYNALAQVALGRLPMKNKKELSRLLKG